MEQHGNTLPLNTEGCPVVKETQARVKQLEADIFYNLIGELI